MSQSIEELQQAIAELEGQLLDQQGEALLAKGCYHCGGTVELGTRQVQVHLVAPCSVGSMHQEFVICIECQQTIRKFLNKED